jgi:hypothetical protein
VERLQNMSPGAKEASANLPDLEHIPTLCETAVGLLREVFYAHRFGLSDAKGEAKSLFLQED